MAGNTLNVNAVLQCPHGGTVQIVPSNLRAKAAGALIATRNDTFIVSSCPFVLPSGTPSPCLTVRWVVTDSRVKANNAATLSQASQGLCLNAVQAPQGPVLITSTQPKVSSQ